MTKERVRQLTQLLSDFALANQRIGSADPSVCFDPYINAYKSDAARYRAEIMDLVNAGEPDARILGKLGTVCIAPRACACPECQPEKS
jgi:hypothetical protein